MQEVAVRLVVEVLVFVEEVPDQGREDGAVVGRLGVGEGVRVAEVPSSEPEDGFVFVASFRARLGFASVALQGVEAQTLRQILGSKNRSLR